VTRNYQRNISWANETNHDDGGEDELAVLHGVNLNVHDPSQAPFRHNPRVILGQHLGHNLALQSALVALP